MTEIHLDLAETTVDGGTTRHRSLTRDACPELAVHRIKHLGLTDAAVPYRRVRWRFAWIRYDEPEHVRPLVSAASPVRVRCDVASLWRIVSGLLAEWEKRRDPRLMHHWIELAHGEAKRIAQPRQLDERLWAVWEDVAGNLSAEWTLQSLASRYRASREQFRRVCLRELGRSPMQHLTSLRIERAQHLLAGTDDKVESIARQVGFEDASVFSRAFKRWVGRSPKAYRE